MGQSLRLLYLAFALLLPLLVTACGEKPEEIKKPHFKEVTFSALDGWENDNFAEALDVLQKSCARIIHRPGEHKFGPDTWSGTYGDWKPTCQKALTVIDLGNGEARAFFEAYFTPYSISASKRKKDKDGLFTGYYEPSLRGTKEKMSESQSPLYTRPDDLIMVQLGDFRDDLKGRRIAGRVVNGRLFPYEDRAEIEAGKLSPARQDIIAWANDPIDAFFLQIQGSGRIYLEDTMEEIRVGYAAQNGHPYFAIGRALIDKGELTKETVSLQTIRAWLEAHPERAAAIMNLNKSYVFFTKLEGDGPLGGEGIALTPGRSLAIDHSLYPYGMPLWVDIEHPDENLPAIRRVMMAQDTGGAIRGAVRGDVFWGHGEEAEYYAGHMKSEGQYWALLPKSLAPAITAYQQTIQ